MKKTVNIHIKGYRFVIEEDAYSKLEAYLLELRRVLQGQDGASEIVEDLEIRIAELVFQKSNHGILPVSFEIIQEVILIIGDPSIFKEEATEEHFETMSSEKIEKRLYRDPEDRIVGGVCSGVASYLNISPKIVRIVWILAVLFGGFGGWIYVLLWILVPKAVTSLDRLRMKGKPISMQSVKDEVRTSYESVRNQGKEYANKVRYSEPVRQTGHWIGNGFRWIIGVFCAFWGLIFLASFVSVLFDLDGVHYGTINPKSISIFELGDLFFKNEWAHFFAWVSFILFFVSIISFFLLAAMVLFFDIRNRWYRRVNLSLLLMMVVSIVMGIFVAISAVNEYKFQGYRSVDFTNNLPQDNLRFNLAETTKYYQNNPNNSAIELNGNEIISSDIQVNYKMSTDSLIHVSVSTYANGVSQSIANANVKNIDFKYEIQNNQVIFSPFFKYPKQDKFRNQRVVIKIELPKGKKVYFGEAEIELDEYNEYAEGLIRSDGTYKHYWDETF